MTDSKLKAENNALRSRINGYDDAISEATRNCPEVQDHIMDLMAEFYQDDIDCLGGDE